MLLDELEALVIFLQAMYPERQIERQNIPLNPESGTLVVRFLGDSTEIETSARAVHNRSWDIVYFAYDTQDALRVMDEITSTVANTRLMIPIPDSLSYLRANSVAFSKPFENENEQDVIIGVLYTQSRTALSQEHYDKVQKVSLVIK